MSGKKVMCRSVLALAVAAASISNLANAAEVFNVTGTVNGAETRSFGFSSAEDILEFPRHLSSRFATYTNTSQADLNIDFRGLGMTAVYGAGLTHLEFMVPSLGIHEIFPGTTREESQQAFSDFMKKNGGEILSRIMKQLAAVSPHDPIAGNPNSMMSQMVANDFATAFNGIGSNIGSKREDGDSSNLIGVGARFSSLRQNGIDNRSLTIPFSYTIRADIDPRRQLIINAPVTLTEVGGAKAYNIGLGAAYRLPMNDNWTITPAVNYGAAGSKDLGAFGQAISASLSSTYVFEGKGYDIVVGNMVGYYTTLKLSAGGYSYNPEIANVVFRNGVMFSQPVTVFGKRMSIEYSLIDTRFTGTKLYNEGYDEIGVTLGTNRNASSARSFFRAGANVLFGPRTKGFSLNLGYWF